MEDPMAFALIKIAIHDAMNRVQPSGPSVALVPNAEQDALITRFMAALDIETNNNELTLLQKGHILYAVPQRRSTMIIEQDAVLLIVRGHSGTRHIQQLDGKWEIIQAAMEFWLACSFKELPKQGS